MTKAAYLAYYMADDTLNDQGATCLLSDPAVIIAMIEDYDVYTVTIASV